MMIHAIVLGHFGKTRRACRLGPAIAALFAFLHPAIARDVNVLFNENCAKCHGANLQGGSAKSLLTGEWNHGSDDESIARVIREGDVEKGMPSWKNTFTDAEIRALVVLLREKITKAKQSANSIPKPIDDQTVDSIEHRFRYRTIAEGLDTPWSIAFLPDGRMLVAERPGRLRIVENGRLLPQAVADTPRVRNRGQGGLMAVAPHPGYTTNGWIYLAFSDIATNDNKEAGMTAVVRGRITNNQWTNEETIFRAPQTNYLPTTVHYGCRLVFDHQNHLFFCIGERGLKEHAQDLSRPNGKVHRVFDDGRIPPDNPFVGQSNAVPSIWCYGNRNPQGLVRHPVTGDLWETEHGPRGGDELNLIQRGRNYGWPIITHGMNYNGTPITEFTAKTGLEQPVIHWTPSIAVCGMDFYFGKTFPRWQGNLFVTALAQQELRRLVLDGRRVTQQEVLFKNIGRVRDVRTGPDGFIYVALNGPDKIIRLEPLP